MSPPTSVSFLLCPYSVNTNTNVRSSPLHHLPEKQNTLYHCCVPHITEYSVLGSFLFCSKGSVLTLGRMCFESSFGHSFVCEPGLGWDPPLPSVSIVTLGTSPLLPHLRYPIKRGHCEIKYDVTNRALLSTSLSRWWFPSLPSVLFYRFILYNMVSVTFQSSVGGEDPACHCR